MNDGSLQTQFADEDMSGLPSPVRLAQEMGEGLAAGQILFDRLSQAGRYHDPQPPDAQG